MDSEKLVPVVKYSTRTAQNLAFLLSSEYSTRAHQVGTRGIRS